MISIVIPAYNASSTILRTLDSLLNKEVVDPSKIIVVVSGEDNTVKLINEHFPSIQLIKHDGKLLPGAARNIGWKQTKGDIVAFLDADCIALDNWFNNISDTFNKSEINVVTGAFISAQPTDIFGAISFAAELGSSLPSGEIRPSILAPAGNTSYQRIVLEECGGFVENTWLEDTILANRAAAKGFSIVFNPKVCVEHINRQGWKSLLSAMKRSGYYSGVARTNNNLRGSWITKYRLLILLLPLYRMFNMYIVSVKKKNPDIMKLILAFPIVGIAMNVWAFNFWRGINDSKTK